MAATKTLRKTISFDISHESDHHGNFFAHAAESSKYEINFVELKNICNNYLANMKNLNTLGLGAVEDEICKIVHMLNICAMGIVYKDKIPELESEIKNNCSPEAWEIYRGVREVVPFIAKLTEYLKLLLNEQTHGNDGADGNRKQIDWENVLQTHVNKCEMDLKKFSYDLSLIKDDITTFHEKVATIQSTCENISKGNLKEFDILLKRLQGNCDEQFEQIEELIRKQDCDLKTLNEVAQYDNGVKRNNNEECTNQVVEYEKTVRQLRGELVSLRDRNEECTSQGHNTRENVCTICKRINRMVEKSSETQQQCSCCVLRPMPQDERDRRVGVWENECFCCRCLARKVRNDIIDIMTAVQNHSQDVRDVHSGTGWEL